MGQHIEPGFAEQVDAAFATVVARLAADRIDVAEAEVNMAVTGRTDAEVALIQRRAAEFGFGAMRFVDDAPVPRPGTIASATLTPLHSSLAAEARAQRLLNDRS